MSSRIWAAGGVGSWVESWSGWLWGGTSISNLLFRGALLTLLVLLAQLYRNFPFFCRPGLCPGEAAVLWDSFIHSAFCESAELKKSLLALLRSYSGRGSRHSLENTHHSSGSLTLFALSQVFMEDGCPRSIRVFKHQHRNIRWISQSLFVVKGIIFQ